MRLFRLSHDMTWANALPVCSRSDRQIGPKFYQAPGDFRNPVAGPLEVRFPKACDCDVSGTNQTLTATKSGFSAAISADVAR
jgi:hypothetical protein